MFKQLISKLDFSQIYILYVYNIRAQCDSCSDSSRNRSCCGIFVPAVVVGVTVVVAAGIVVVVYL